MLLCVNIGNSSISLAAFDGSKLVLSKKFPSAAPLVSQEQSLRALAESLESQNYRIHAIALSSVVPKRSAPLIAVLKDAFPGATEPWVLSHTRRINFSISIPKPEELGADLLANAAFAATLGEPAIIVDFGTALSFTVLDVLHNAAALRGAVIFPGPVMALRSLASDTALLPQLAPGLPKQAIGTSTETAIQSGIFYGYRGAIDSICTELAAELSAAPRLLLTGGSHEVFMDHLAGFEPTMPFLTLEGLRILFELNQN